jgi:hypothetical protein
MKHGVLHHTHCSLHQPPTRANKAIFDYLTGSPERLNSSFVRKGLPSFSEDDDIKHDVDQHNGQARETDAEKLLHGAQT